MFYHTRFCLDGRFTLSPIANFDEASCREVSGHGGAAHLTRNSGYPLDPEGWLQLETDTLDPMTTRKQILHKLRTLGSGSSPAEPLIRPQPQPMPGIQPGETLKQQI